MTGALRLKRRESSFDIPYLERAVICYVVAAHHIAQVAKRVLWQNVLAERANSREVVCLKEGHERREIRTGQSQVWVLLGACQVAEQLLQALPW